VLALVHHQKSEFLLQLRDFDASILHPGHWGGFGGHREPEETPVEAMYRELNEELGFRPQRLEFVRRVWVERDDAETYVFACPVLPAVCEFTLGEGQEICWFKSTDILAGALPSQKWQRSFPVTPPLPPILSYFIGKDAAENSGSR